jgi:hypothetical protein
MLIVWYKGKWENVGETVKLKCNILLQNRLNCQKVITIELRTWNVTKTRNVINFSKVVYFLNNSLILTMKAIEPLKKLSTNQK